MGSESEVSPRIIRHYEVVEPGVAVTSSPFVEQQMNAVIDAYNGKMGINMKALVVVALVAPAFSQAAKKREGSVLDLTLEL